MKILSIPPSVYDEYRLDVIFKGYKWDPQFFDNNTVASHVLVISEKEAAELNALTEKLAAETIAAENILNKNMQLTASLALPRPLKKALATMSNYDAEKHVRLMRFDFHPIVGGGYAVSEVNSDVPGGFAESSVMPSIAVAYLGAENYRYTNFMEILIKEICQRVGAGGKIALIHCTSYSDDRQVMQFLGDSLEKAGRRPIYAASDHLKFENGKAISVLDGYEGKVDFIFRFTPLEWLIGIKPKTWPGYFNTVTPSCNHPVTIYAQSKRFPLVFDSLEKLGVDLSAWRSLLPKTLDVKDAKGKEDFIFKPACGRVGEKISIKSACSEEEYNKIIKDVKRHPKDFVSQKMFISQPLTTDESEEFHVCLGSYSIESKASGFYARISKSRRIDSGAADIPVLIEKDRI